VCGCVGKKVSNRGGCCLGVAAGVEKSKAKGGGGCVWVFLGFFCGLGFSFFVFF
jgi:hypothetical protein